MQVRFDSTSGLDKRDCDSGTGSTTAGSVARSWGDPCVGSDGGVFQCAPAARVIAVRAGRLFDSNTGRMLTKQVVIISGQRITEIGPEAQVNIPSAARVIDLSQATVLPGLIDAHTHMFNTGGPRGTTETS
jgi:hypothetical protein